MTDFNFDDRTSWLAYRADWRLRYKAASEAIRSTKREIAEHRRLRRELGAAGASHTHAADSLQYGLARQRVHASSLMRELDAAKEQKAEMMADMDKPLAA